MNETTVVTIITIMRELPNNKVGGLHLHAIFIMILCMHMVGARQIAIGTYTCYEFLKDKNIPIFFFFVPSVQAAHLKPWFHGSPSPLPPFSDSITIQNTIKVLASYLTLHVSIIIYSSVVHG